ncbi:MAG: DUF6537 domain-containing protein, partial [Betaproteobacteria bacterium]
HLDAWLTRATRAFAHDYRFGVEVVRCRRAIKGYSDTHARGLTRFDRLMRAAEQLQGRTDSADALASLLSASLADAQGGALERRWKALELQPL